MATLEPSPWTAWRHRMLDNAGNTAPTRLVVHERFPAVLQILHQWLPSTSKPIISAHLRASSPFLPSEAQLLRLQLDMVVSRLDVDSVVSVAPLAMQRDSFFTGPSVLVSSSAPQSLGLTVDPRELTPVWWADMTTKPPALDLSSSPAAAPIHFGFMISSSPNSALESGTVIGRCEIVCISAPHPAPVHNSQPAITVLPPVQSESKKEKKLKAESKRDTQLKSFMVSQQKQVEELKALVARLETSAQERALDRRSRIEERWDRHSKQTEELLAMVRAMEERDLKRSQREHKPREKRSERDGAQPSGWQAMMGKLDTLLSKVDSLGTTQDDMVGSTPSNLGSSFRLLGSQPADMAERLRQLEARLLQQEALVQEERASRRTAEAELLLKSAIIEKMARQLVEAEEEKKELAKEAEEEREKRKRLEDEVLVEWKTRSMSLTAHVASMDSLADSSLTVTSTSTSSVPATL